VIGSKVVSGAIMDKRVVSKKILEGSMAVEDLEKHLNELPDLSGSAEEVTIEEED